MLNYDRRLFGVANERIMCCKYLYHTRETPGFCSKFNRGGLNLGQYCSGNLWKGRYTKLSVLQAETSKGTNATLDEDEEAYLMEMASDSQGEQYAFVRRPVEWLLEKRPSEDGGHDAAWVCRRSQDRLLPGLYLRGEVEGDYDYGTEAASGHHRRHITTGEFVEVGVVAGKDGAVTRTLLFDAREPIEVPLDEQGRAGEGDVLESRSSMAVVLQEGELCRVLR